MRQFRCHYRGPPAFLSQKNNSASSFLTLARGLLNSQAWTLIIIGFYYIVEFLERNDCNFINIIILLEVSFEILTIKLYFLLYFFVYNI